MRILHKSLVVLICCWVVLPAIAGYSEMRYECNTAANAYRCGNLPIYEENGLGKPVGGPFMASKECSAF